MLETCPYCGSDDVTYSGIDDGGGDYGSGVCDQYDCDNCGQAFEGNCIDADDLDDEDTVPVNTDAMIGTRYGETDLDDIPF